MKFLKLIAFLIITLTFSFCGDGSTTETEANNSINTANKISADNIVKGYFDTNRGPGFLPN